MTIQTSRKAQAELRKNRSLVELTFERDLLAVLSTPEGRRVMLHIVQEICGAFNASFTGDPLTTAYNEGRRRPGLDLLGVIQAKYVDQYAMMLDEQLNLTRRDRLTEEVAETAAKLEESDG